MRVSVFGSSRLAGGSREYEEGRRLGRLLAEGGHTVLSGGYAGLMEAVSRGAHEAGGTAVGVTMAPWSGRLTPNPYLGEERAVATLFQRIEALVETECLIALRGGAGTLSEVSLAWNLRQMDLMPAKPVILVGSSWPPVLNSLAQWLVIDEGDIRLLTLVETVEEAVALLPTGKDQAGV